MKTKAKKVVTGIVVTFLLLLAGAAVWFFQFTKNGYILTVPYRSYFEQIAENVYVNKDNAMSKDEILNLIHEAEDRDRDFYGELTYASDTTIILNDNEKIQPKLGGGKDTYTFLFPKKHDYTCLSNEYFNLDIVAHEITHTELHARLTKEARSAIPIWFDEGLATQNDYRERYSLESWIEKTDNGKNVPALEDIDEPREFHCEEESERQFHYIIAKHEVGLWMEAHHREGLMDLIDRLNKGEDFNNVYGI